MKVVTRAKKIFFLTGRYYGWFAGDVIALPIDEMWLLETTARTAGFKVTTVSLGRLYICQSDGNGIPTGEAVLVNRVCPLVLGGPDGPRATWWIDHLVKFAARQYYTWLNGPSTSTDEEIRAIAEEIKRGRC